MATKAGHPAWLLTAAEGYLGDRSNERTARGFTCQGLSIKASFFPSPPPQPSTLWVHCPDAGRIEPPRVLYTAGDLILFRIPIFSDPAPNSWLLPSDYFVYRADPISPDLTLITDNNDDGEEHIRYIRDCEVGILPRGLHNYTIAALVVCPLILDRFKLYLFHSETSIWTSIELPVAEPQEGFGRIIPPNTDLRCHATSNVITIGGEYGTMGWVDLWRGIVLCDVLRENPTLRGIPLPLPMHHITGGNGMGLYLGRAMDCRGIAFVNGCLKFVELEIYGSCLDFIDPETGHPPLMVSEWRISSWINTEMDNSYKAWGDPECTVQASEVKIKTDMISHPTGMMLLPSEENVENQEQEAAYFPRLVISEPSPSLDGDGVVYLIGRVKLCHQKSWILALDMNNKTLQSVIPLGTVKDPSDSVMYCTSRSASNS